LTQTLLQTEQTESQLVADIRNALELSGYIVREINQRRADLAGGDVSWDLAICHEKRGACSLNMEVKTGKGRLSQRRPRSRNGLGFSQQDLFDMGLIVVVRSVGEAVSTANEWREGFVPRR
jgi:hypothetical protein